MSDKEEPVEDGPPDVEDGPPDVEDGPPDVEDGPPDVTKFLDAVISHFFEKAIMSASSDQKRTQVAVEFGMNRRVGYESILRIFEFIELIRNEGGAADTTDILQRYAEVAYNVFVRHRTRLRRRGVEIDTVLDDGKIISSFGHSLNEGITQWLTIKIFPDVISKVLPDLLEGLEDFKSDAYVLEVELADRLIKIFSEETVTKACIGDDESYKHLVQVIDQRFGEGAYRKIIELSDNGRWRDTFRFIDSSEKAAEAREESDGTN